MLEVEIVEPESPRYAAELVFLPGFWTSSRAWLPAARGLAHRGWRVVLLDTAERALRADPARLVDALDAWLRQSIAGDLPPDWPPEAAGRDRLRPVVVGHGAGALTAMALAARGCAGWAVAAAPWLDGPEAWLPWGRRVLARVGVGDLSFAASLAAGLAGAPQSVVARVTASARAEPAAALAGYRRLAPVPASPVPALFVAHRDDAHVAPMTVAITARGVEADLVEAPGGHWAHADSDAEPWIAPVHRWLVRTGGSSLMLLRGDEDL